MAGSSPSVAASNSAAGTLADADGLPALVPHSFAFIAASCGTSGGKAPEVEGRPIPTAGLKFFQQLTHAADRAGKFIHCHRSEVAG